jgi:hypothetical protein
MEMSGQLHTLAALRRGNSPSYQFDRRLDRPWSRSGRCGEQKNHALPGIEPGPSSPQPVTIPTEISQCCLI